MKRNVLHAVFLAVACGLTYGVHAQFMSQVDESPNPFTTVAEQTLVRNYDSIHVVGFASGLVSGIQKEFFYVAEANEGVTPFGNALWMEAPAGCTVKDIYCLGEYAYFCGIDDSSRMMIGCFSVADLIGGVSPMACEYISRADSLGVDTLFRLVAVPLSGTSNVMASALGRKHIANAFFSPSPGFMDSRRLNTTADGETLYDMVLKNDTVYIFGTDVEYGALTMRKGLSMNVLWPGINDVFRFRPTVGRVDLHGCCATAMPGDRVAVAFQVMGNGNLYLNMAVLEPAALSVVDHQAYMSQHRLVFRDMRYMPSSQRLVLLYHDPSMAKTPIMEWNPFVSGSYYANALIPNERLFSLDRLTPNQFTTVGGNRWMVQHAFAATDWQYSCQPAWGMPVVQYKVNYASTKPEALVPVSASFSKSTHTSSPFSTTFTAICIH